jgi:hypothetical protein
VGGKLRVATGGGSLPFILRSPTPHAESLITRDGVLGARTPQRARAARGPRQIGRPWIPALGSAARQAGCLDAPTPPRSSGQPRSVSAM